MSTTEPIRTEKSAGGVVLREIGGVTHALVIRDPYRNWGLPKGHLENDETSARAALREVAEETGLDDLRLGPELVTIDWYFRAQGAQIHKFTTFYLMHSDAGEAIPQKAEGISDCLWVPLAEADKKITYDNAGEVMRVAQRVVMESSESE